MKLSLVFVATALVTSGMAYAAGNGSSPNGKPFIALQSQIDQIEADLAALEDEFHTTVAVLEGDISDLQVSVADLQAQIDANDADILALQQATGDNADAIAALEAANADLQSQIDDVNAELLTKQDVLDGTSGCPTGYALRVVYPDGSYLCEYDNPDLTTYVSRTVRYGAYRSVTNPYYQSVATVNCPSGWFATGGGSDVRYSTYRRTIALNESMPYSNGWRVTAVRGYNSYSNYVRAVAMCLRNYH